MKLPDGTLPVLNFDVVEDNRETDVAIYRSFLKASESIVKFILKKNKPSNHNLRRYQEASLDFFIENSDNTA